MPSFEYMFLSQPLSLSWADLTPRAHSESLLRVSGQILPAIAEQLDTVGGGGWEAISHDLLRLDDGLLLTVMARRPATPSEDS